MHAPSPHPLIPTSPQDTFIERVRRLHKGKALFVLVLAWYTSAYFRRDDAYLLLDHVDLAIHEAGHVVFALFGEFAAVAGGTLLQLLVPAAFLVYFALTRQRFAACVVLFWLAQSLFNVARYAADARAQLLPLVGGEYVIHDWSWMLSRLHLLRHDETVGALFRTIGNLLWLAALAGALHYAVRPRTDELPAMDAPADRPAV